MGARRGQRGELSRVALTAHFAAQTDVLWVCGGTRRWAALQRYARTCRRSIGELAASLAQKRSGAELPMVNPCEGDSDWG